MRVNNNNIDDWKTSNLGRIAIITNGKTNVQDAVIGGKYPLFDRSIEIKRSNKFLFDKTAIILPGEGAEFIPRFYSGKFDLHQRAYAIFPDKQVDARYLYYYIDSKRSYLTRKSVGSTVKSLRLPIIQSMPIIFPALDEQDKIAEVLSAVDEDIEKTDAVIEKTEKLKKGLMQQLLSNSVGYRKERLKNLLQLVIDHRGLTPKKLGGQWIDFGVQAISAMNIKSGRIVKPEEIRFVDEKLYKKWMSAELAENDVLLTSEAPLGEVYLMKEGEKYCLSQRLFGLRADAKKILGEYIFWFLSSPVGQKNLLERATGSTAKGIRQSELLKVEINFPDLDKQREVSSFFSSLEEKISLTKKNKEKLIQLKKGLTSDLLSGKVTVQI